MKRNSNLIYFNNNRTTRPDEEVQKSMLQLEDANGNDRYVHQEAKKQLSALIGALPGELLFTSGTTQSVYLALKGAFGCYKHKGKHIITNSTEHFAVLDCCRELEQEGAEVTYLDVDREGLVDPEALRAAIRPDTVLVSIMAANNETGVIQPIEKISEICRENQLLFFSDASQFAGKVRCDVKELGIDCMAFGAHKMYGPEGIGLLFIDERYDELAETIRNTYETTVSTAQIAGFGKAAEISTRDHWENSTHVSKLKNYFEHQILDLEGLRINGSTKHRLYNTSNITFSDHKKILPLLERFDFAENVKKPSYVLKAMGLNDEDIKNSFRFSFGKYNTLEEVKLLVEDLLST